ncbi:MAG: CPBP family intramembrane glutamic endopeptidase [Candidatus Hodarchaeales archaeon]|jgi:membrane protease YdiL (CAAX protease family)
MKKSQNRGVVLKSDLPWSNLEMWIRLIIYFILICTLLFLLQFGIGSILSTSDFSVNIQETVFFSFTGILGIGLTWLFLKFDDRPMKQVGLFRPDRPMFLFLIALIVTPLALIVGFIIEIIFDVIDPDKMIEGIITDPVILISLTIVTILGIGIGEEIMFRGYIQRLLESNMSFWKAATISSILFGVLHSFLRVADQDGLNAMLAVGVSATAFGFMFAYAYYKTGRSLFFPIIIHSFWDLGIFIFDTEFNYSSIVQVIFEIVSQILAALVLIAVIYYYAEYFPPQKKLPDWNKEN